jgi:type I restriction enzyme S subunit
MANDWHTKSLADIIEIIGGGTPKTNVAEYWNGEIPWLSVVDFNTGNRWVSKTEKHITELGLKESSTVMLRSRDIIISARGTVGVLAQLTRPMAFNQSCYGIRGIDAITDTDFIYYTLKHAVTGLKKIAHGAVFDTITRDTFKVIEVSVPPLVEQKRIASVLGALDDKIEIIGQINERLEATARALFQSWFVDFDPVRAKLDGSNPICLDEDTAKLFPHAFQESELGLIPKGWRLGALSEGFNITMGQSPPGNTYNELGEGLPFYQGCTDFGFRFPKRRIYCTAPNRTAKDRDTLVSVRAPVGDINMAKEECCIGRGVAAVRHKSGASSFTYHAIANLYPDFAKFEAEGTVFGSINKDSFEKLPFVMPPAEIVSAFERIAEPLDEQIRILVEQSHTLANIRNALLPKLLNGELSVENLKS